MRKTSSVKIADIKAAYVIAIAMSGSLFFALPTSVCLGQTFEDRTEAYFGPGAILNFKAAWGDVNNDGWVDLAAYGKIYRNEGGTSFAVDHPIVAVNGLWGDIDNNGFLDFFSYGDKTLLDSGSNGTNWANRTRSMIPNFDDYGSHISWGGAWGDFNNDGHLDIYVGGAENFATNTTYADFILTYNKTTQQFDQTWQETVYRARGVAVADYDRDGDQDIYVSNYRLQPNRLWQTTDGVTMTDVAASVGVAGAANSIGSAWGDFDNDGNLDLFVGNFSHAGQEPSHFLKNLGPSGNYQFQNMKDLSTGADWQESYGTPTLGDYDNDGDLDLFFTTVYGTEQGSSDHPRLYRNDGNWQFTDVTASEGLANLGPTYQAAWADVDRDGDLDLMTDGKLFISDTQANGNHWLEVRVEGNGTTVNTIGIGTQVLVHADALSVLRQVEGGTGEGNQNDLTLHFGLGSYNSLVDLEVLWPDGTTEWFTGVGIDQLMQVVQGTSVPEPSTLSLLAIAAIAVCRRRRRSFQAQN